MSLGKTHHVCRERGLESDCPICGDFLFTSHTPVKVNVFRVLEPGLSDSSLTI